MYLLFSDISPKFARSESYFISLGFFERQRQNLDWPFPVYFKSHYYWYAKNILPDVGILKDIRFSLTLTESPNYLRRSPRAGACSCLLAEG